ncbi:MAG: fructose-bisphosphatase class III [Mediterraneibacter faecis]
MMQRKQMLNMKMHKAISIIQFKGGRADYQKKSMDFSWNTEIFCIGLIMKMERSALDGKTYELLDKNFPTIDPKRPYALTEAEEEVLDRLTQAFVNCEKLQKHMRFLLSKGGSIQSVQ